MSNRGELIATLRALNDMYSLVGMGHTHVMLNGVVNSDRLPFVIVQRQGMIQGDLLKRKCREIALRDVATKLKGVAGPVAWEHTALQHLIRACLSEITNLEAEVLDREHEIRRLQEP